MGEQRHPLFWRQTELPSQKTDLKCLSTLIIWHWIRCVWNRFTSISDQVIDSVGTVTRRMQHPANDPVLAQNPFLDQAVQDLLDLRAQTNKNSVLQLCDLSSEIFHEVFTEQRMLGHVRIATIVIVIHKDRIAQ